MKPYRTLIITTALAAIYTPKTLAQIDYTDTIPRAYVYQLPKNIVKQDFSPSSVIRLQDRIATPALDYYFPELVTAQSKDLNYLGKAGTEQNLNNKPGYASLEIGTGINIDAKLGYAIVDNNKDRLTSFLSYNATNSTIDFLNSEFDPKSADAKYADLLAKVNYSHLYSNCNALFDLSYQNLYYNYYGNKFHTVSDARDWLQNINFLQTNARITPTDSSQWINDKSIGLYIYDNYFHSKDLQLTNKQGFAFNSQLRLGKNFAESKSIIATIGFDAAGSALQSDGSKFDGLFTLRASADYKLKGEKWDANLGVKLEGAYQNLSKNFLPLVAPSLSANYRLATSSKIYLNAGGAINNNDFKSVVYENPYLLPVINPSLPNSMNIEPSRTWIDSKIGFMTGELKNFSFDIFGGYKYTQNEHLYAQKNFVKLPTDDVSFHNYSTPLYTSLGTAHIGASVYTTVIPLTELSFTGKFYGYQVGKFTDLQQVEAKPFGLPAFTIETAARFSPMDNLTVTLQNIIMGGRTALLITPYAENENAFKMKDIYELNVRADYRFLDFLTANIAFNNLLFQKYEVFYGYTHQGFNVTAGATLVF